jgi:uncharacterized protein (DUF305 family)
MSRRMTAKKTTLAVLAAVAALGTSAAIAQMQGLDMQKMMQALSPQASDPAPTKDFKAAHMNMMKNMNMEFSGDPDADFARSMMKHHQSGIEMAQIEIKHGKNPEMKKMAEKLVEEQGKDNKEFQAFLSKLSK